MSPTLRRLLSVIAALIVAGGIVMLIETFAAQLHPLPPGVDPTDPASLGRALEAGQVPFAALALVMSGWLLAAYVGGVISWRYGRSGAAAVIFAVIFTAAVLSNLLSFPHPTWMWIGGLGGCPLFALGGGNRTLTVPRTP
jgi:hypothetical protein